MRIRPNVFLSTVLFLSASVSLLTPVHAQEKNLALSTGQAEWRQGFDGGLRQKKQDTNAPLLSSETISNTENAIARYQQIVSQGGWPTINNNVRLKLGSQGPEVGRLKQILLIMGDLDQSAATGDTFDSYVEAAVKKFQRRHGLTPTGFFGSQSAAAMNVTAAVRLNQLATNLVRLKSLGGNLGGRFVTVNIPGAEIETVQNGVVATRHSAIVGKSDRQSPVMSAKITQVNFNPYWTVPVSIIRKDLIPKMQKDPAYLTDNKIRIFDSKGNEVQPQQINWNSQEAVNYRFRQEPGEINSMGAIRVNIPNPHGVYMHDTPSKNLFGQDFRFHSSGCVRVQNVRDYVNWLLSDTSDWNKGKIEQTIRSGSRTDATLRQPVSAYWVYITAWARSNGSVEFRDDIYSRDGLGSIATDLPADTH